jgi:probable HAF family extracellular repeat protein
MFLGCALCAALAGPLPAQAQGRYAVTPVAAANSSATDINRLGQVAGNIDTGGAYHAFISSGGVTTDLGSLGGQGSFAARMNDLGQVVGTSATGADGASAAFIYSNGIMSALPLAPFGAAQGINNAGAVTGTAWVPGADGDGSYHAYVLQGGKLTDLGTAGRLESRGYDINSLGHVAGSIATPDSGPPNRPTNAMYFHDGQMIDLGTGGYSGPWSVANAINDHDQLAGSLGVDFPDDPGQLYPTLAFVFQNGQMQTLGGFGPNLSSWAGDINNLGQVVGAGFTGFGQDHWVQHAFIWQNGALTDLNSLIDPTSGWVIEDATAINDLGQIAGKACMGGTCYAVRLDLVSAVPEPRTAGMLLAGLGLLGVAVRRPARRRRGSLPRRC